MIRSPCPLLCFSISICAPVALRMALMLHPARPITRLMALSGTETFFTLYVGLIHLRRTKSNVSFSALSSPNLRREPAPDTHFLTTSFHSSSPRREPLCLPFVTPFALPLAVAFTNAEVTPPDDEVITMLSSWLHFFFL